jgi:hypothetical protein
MAIPKQRGPGQRGGDGGRGNRGTFRNVGGSVPPKKSCPLAALMVGLWMLAFSVAGATVWELVA